MDSDSDSDYRSRSPSSIRLRRRYSISSSSRSRSRSLGGGYNRRRAYSPDTSSDSDHYFPKPPKPKFNGEDRLSALPDSLIHYILSFLPVEDAIKTGCLSTRWRNLWTVVPKLTFKYLGKGRLEKFFDFVNKTLIQYFPQKIQELAFAFNRELRDRNLDPHINRWLLWASQHGASEISLEIFQRSWIRSRYWMPNFFFNNSSLAKLVTKSCFYRPVGDVCWGSLRSLSIGNAEMPGDVLQRILLGSPMLQSLALYKCWDLNSIDVSSSSRLEYLQLNKCWSLENLIIGSCSRLETLVLENMGHGEDDAEIDCPSLKTLKIMGVWRGRICRLLDVSSLVNACLDFEVSVASEACFGMVNEMLQKIDRAKQITLGSWIVQALSILEFRGLPSPWTNFNCQRLTLFTDLNDGWTVFGMISLLESLPTLETLVLDCSKHCSQEMFLPNSDGIIEDYFQEKNNLSFSCLPGHLKTFEIVCPDYDFDQSNLFSFVQLLLANARALEKLVVFFEQNASYLEKLLSVGVQEN